jgi:hypothetical protein
MHVMFIGLLSGLGLCLARGVLATSRSSLHMVSIYSAFPMPSREPAYTGVDDPSAHRAVARPIKGDVSSAESRQQIRERLRECLAKHTLCSNNKSHVRPLRLLDIRDKDNAKVCSLDATRLDQYVALSYCWGEDQPFKTTLSTLGSRKEGISVSVLPKTIRDAIEITRQLNIDFLWVDSLCIVQDSEDEKAKEVGDMSHYYGNSLLTISAAKARVCSEGFLAPGGAGERFEQYRNGPFQLKLAFDDFKCEIITLAQEEPPPKEPIDTRGWTLQEGLLATRLVSFGDSSTWWSCSTSTYRLSSIPTLREEAKELRKIPALRGSDWQSLMLWNKIIQDYSARTLKFPADKLPAISGIAQELSAAFPPPEQLDMPKYVAGLWNVRTLPLQLLWTPMRGLTRYSDDVDTDYVAPSWSWASVSGAISPDIFLNPSDQIVESEVTIVDCKVDRVNQHAPYGALSGASLTLKSKAWDGNFENLCEEGVELRLDTAEDEKAVRAVGGEVTCLAVIRPKYVYQLKETQQSIDTTPKGLVLIKKGVGTYRRVGVYYREYVPSPRESRERWNSYLERTFTIE